MVDTLTTLAQHLVMVEPTEADAQELSDATTEADYTPAPVQAIQFRR